MQIIKSPQKPQTKYILRLADNSLILGQRLAEMCGHAPEMELDMALINIALDLIGQARFLYEHVLSYEDLAKTADALAMTRELKSYTPCHLVSRPNHNFAHIVLRQYLFSTMQEKQFQALLTSSDKTLAGFAEKSLKEIAYHVRFAKSWVLRLGDGTEESHFKMQNALSEMWRFTGEMWQADNVLLQAVQDGLTEDFSREYESWQSEVCELFKNAGGLECPQIGRMIMGGYQGEHGEELGHVLKDLQFMQLKYPGLEW